jgi:hypothetical protein
VPLSLHVERNWFSRELLAAMDAKITELMGREKESENPARVLFLPGRKTAARTGG